MTSEFSFFNSNQTDWQGTYEKRRRKPQEDNPRLQGNEERKPTAHQTDKTKQKVAAIFNYLVVN